MVLINRQEAFEIFDGTMLGDGSIQMNGHNAFFRIGLSGKPDCELIAYLTNMKNALTSMGLPISADFPKMLHGISRGKDYTYCSLATRNSPSLTSEFLRWYPHGLKIVPDDVRLSALSLAHFFMQDGQSSHDNRYVPVNVALNTTGFDLASIIKVEDCLHQLGLSTGRTVRHNIIDGSGIIITILQESVNTFMDMVNPYVVEPFRYKIKYRDKPPRIYRLSPMIYEIPPILGEIRHGCNIGRNQKNAKFLWATCIDCGTPRWIELRKELRQTRCHACFMKFIRRRY